MLQDTIRLSRKTREVTSVKRPLRLTATVAALAFSATAASAAPFLNVDFNNINGVTSPTEGGAGDANSNDSPAFSAFNVNQTAVAGPLSNTYSGVTVTIAGGTTVDGSGNLNGTGLMTSRDRAAPADAETTPNSNTGFTFGELYRDFAFSNGNSLGMELSGLSPATSYSITFYLYDNTATRTQQFTNITGGGSTVAGSIAYTGSTTFTSATPDSIYSLTTTATSDSSGRLLFTTAGTAANDSNFSGLINGLQVSAVPEPASCGLLAAGGIAFLLRRRTPQI